MKTKIYLHKNFAFQAENAEVLRIKFTRIVRTFLSERECKKTGDQETRRTGDRRLGDQKTKRPEDHTGD